MKNEHKRLIKKAVESAKKLRDNQRDISDALWVTPESPMFEPANLCCELMINCASEVVGDVGKYLGWYCFENNFGNGRLMCYIGKKDYVCQSITQLINMIDRYERHILRD